MTTRAEVDRRTTVWFDKGNCVAKVRWSRHFDRWVAEYKFGTTYIRRGPARWMPKVQHRHKTREAAEAEVIIWLVTQALEEP